jgi:hypothetical protein
MVDPRDRPRGLETVPGWLLIVNVVGICVFVAVGLHLYFGADHSTFGLLIAVWAGVITPVAWWQKLRRARSQHDPTRRNDDRTGNVLAPSVADPPSEVSAAERWIGAADLPSPFGRVTTTYQVAVLEIVDGSLTLRLRPNALVRLALRVETLKLRPEDVEAVYPARGRLRIPAIGIRPVHRPPSYFLTAAGPLRWYFGRISSDRSAILSAIESAGFPVAWEERKFSRA